MFQLTDHLCDIFLEHLTTSSRTRLQDFLQKANEKRSISADTLGMLNAIACICPAVPPDAHCRVDLLIYHAQLFVRQAGGRMTPLEYDDRCFR